MVDSKFPPLMRIHKLPAALANQIAAGEVIERPASIVKELMENSFDAGATEITIDIYKGGMQRIRVADNGHGIHPDDMLLALESHATSKVKQQLDLSRITSLGFRGEALPSIASVASFKLSSRINTSEQGWSLSSDPSSDRRECLPVAHPVGTTVEANDLFHSIPARKKFLRSEKTEYLHILETVRRLTLSRFGVTVNLRHNDKNVFSSQACETTLVSRIEDIMGIHFRRSAIALDYIADDMRLWGWLGPKDLSRSQSDRQYFYINGRIIRDKQVNHAIRLAFADDIPVGRYPSYVLYLELDTAATDVNVHPTKHEVRFRHARHVHDFIYASLRNTLSRDEQLSPQENKTGTDVPPLKRDMVADGVVNYFNKELLLSHEQSPGHKSVIQPVNDVYQLGEPVVQLDGRFLLSKRNQKILLIDIAEGRRYITQARLEKVKQDETVRHRPLLVPVIVKVTEIQADLVDNNAVLLAKYGLLLDRVSPTGIMVRAIPTILPDVDILGLLEDTVTIFSQTPIKQSIHEMLTSIYQRHAGYASDTSMTTGEWRQFMHALEDSGLNMQADNCPGIWCTLNPGTWESLLK